MIWNSAADFFAMGGYALYVWGSVIACVLIMVMEPILIRQRQKNILRSLRCERIAEELDRQ
jgi:heme exporter protein D